MVGKDLDLMAGGLEVGAPFLEASDDRQQLFVVDLVVALRGECFLE